MNKNKNSSTDKKRRNKDKRIHQNAALWEVNASQPDAPVHMDPKVKRGAGTLWAPGFP